MLSYPAIGGSIPPLSTILCVFQSNPSVRIEKLFFTMYMMIHLSVRENREVFMSQKA